MCSLTWLSYLAASTISYHTIDIFPEKNYGYIELPEIEADKLRRKLNGYERKEYC